MSEVLKQPTAIETPAAAPVTQAPAAPAEAVKVESKGTILTAKVEAPKVDGAATDAPATEAPVTEAPKVTVPEKYEFKAPEGSSFDEAHLAALGETAKKLGLSQEQAQGLLEREHVALQTYAERQMHAIEQQFSQWENEVRSDKELGGENFGASAEAARRAIERFGTPALMAKLDESGLGNYPELVRVFARVGLAMSDDKTVKAQAHGGQKTRAEILYGGKK